MTHRPGPNQLLWKSCRSPWGYSRLQNDGLISVLFQTLPLKGTTDPGIKCLNLDCPINTNTLTSFKLLTASAAFISCRQVWQLLSSINTDAAVASLLRLFQSGHWYEKVRVMGGSHHNLLHSCCAPYYHGVIFSSCPYWKKYISKFSMIRGVYRESVERSVEDFVSLELV